MLGGCDQLDPSPAFKRICCKSAETLHYRSQRLVAGSRLAWPANMRAADMSPVFRVNGTSMPDSPPIIWPTLANEFRRLAAGRGRAGGAAAVAVAPRSRPFAAARRRSRAMTASRAGRAIGKWQGPQLGTILRAAGLSSRANFIVFHCADTRDPAARLIMNRSTSIDAFHPQTILALLMNDQRLPVRHGAPVRLRVERQLGYKHAKFVMRIEARRRLDDLYRGKGGYWEDRSDYAWYAGI